MNPEGQKQLLAYMTRPLTSLSNTELDSFLWLVEQQLQDLRQQICSRLPPWELAHPNA